jgi:KUP system potassium uptake protein
MTEGLADAANEPSPSDQVKGLRRDRISQPTTLGAALLAMGIVYGDLGTSPLYTLSTIAQILGDQFSPEAALGSLSLIFWSLLVTISVKYCLLVMRADNHGEGGILALMTMTGARWAGRGRVLVIMGLFGAALIYGDGIITPAISVLSALEGLNVATGFFQPYTMPMAVVVLIGLFAIQSRGTAAVGKAFGPIMLLWFLTIAILGLVGVVQHPEVLAAVNPAYGFALLTTHGFAGFAVLGGVFLALTGGEALYADMGHIGRNPIRATWYCLVLPALLLNYAGQIGLFLSRPALIGNPFFRLAPGWLIYPLVCLATLATIIASQAIITGSFSMTRQAMQLGWFPGVRIKQTSDDDGLHRCPHRGVRQLRPARRCLWYRRFDHHGSDHRTALHRDAEAMALAGIPGGRRHRSVPGGRSCVLFGEPAEDSRGWLDSHHDWRVDSHHHDHVAYRYCRAAPARLEKTSTVRRTAQAPR